MKKIILLMLFYSSFTVTLFAQDKGCEIPSSKDIGDLILHFCENCHYANHQNCENFTHKECRQCYGHAANYGYNIKSRPEYRVLRFDVKFHRTTIYSDRKGWNKILKISSAKCLNKMFYLSLGWQWDSKNDRMDLGFYSHIDHREEDPCRQNHNGREFLSLGKFLSRNEVTNETSVPIELIFYAKGFFVRAGERGVAIRRTIMSPILNLDPTHVQLGGYFGGTQCAPHEMAVFVNNIKLDYAPTWWDGTSYKGYTRSEWYDGDNQTIAASDKIELNLQANNEDGVLESFIKFHSGSKVTFITPTLEPAPIYDPDDPTKIIGFSDDNIDFEVGAEVEHIVGTSGTNSGEVFEYDCPSSGKWEYENGSTDDKGEIITANGSLKNSINNTPNPFILFTQFKYSLIKQSSITLTIYNVFGTEVDRLLTEQIQEGGTHTLSYDANGLSAGIYFCIFEAKSEQGEVFKETKKLVKLK